MNLRQGAGFLSMLLESLAGRGGGAMSGHRPLSWADLPLPSLDGGTLPSERFEGRCVLVVNTASKCVFKGQYRALQALWRSRRDRGFVLLGIPSNDFAGQEPGAAAEIRRFCERRYGVDFPLLAKQRVIGPEAHPLYRWAAAEGGAAAVPRWNFHKLLIGPDGRLAGAFASAVSPRAPRLLCAIDKALPSKV